MIITAGGLLTEWLGDIQPQPQYSDIYGDIFFRVGCVKMAAPRHSRFEFLLDMGRNDIDCVFENRKIEHNSLTFIFPERYMSVHEQHGFISAICKHKYANTIKQVDIITSSPIILGEFHREIIQILKWDDDNKHNGKLI